MSAEGPISLDQLVSPVSEGNPTGIDIRKNNSPDTRYYAIKEARNAARAAERSNLFDSDSSEADIQWQKVLELAPEIIQNQTKDLEITCWYTEALVRRYGFQGLRDGFELIKSLMEQYWDDLYPLPDEDGIETRVACLTGLNGEGAEGVLIAPIRNVNLTGSSDPGPFSYWNYQQALEVDKTIEQEAKTAKASKLGFSIADIERAVTESSDSFYADLHDDLQDSLSLYREIGALLDRYCGINDSPPTSNIINILEDCLGAVKHLGKHKIPSTETDDQESDNDSEESAASGSDSSEVTRSTGSIRDRADAFKKIMDISEFFRKTEPHSPIPYILERAVKWGDMPLEDLIKELIPDSSARDLYGSLTGIRTDEDY